MTIEEAIRKIVQLAGLIGPFSPVTNALDKAVGALRAQAEAEKNEPLTPDELREMTGEPVWVCQSDGKRGTWMLVCKNCCTNCADIAGYENYGRWLAYRRKPEEGG